MWFDTVHLSHIAMTSCKINTAKAQVRIYTKYYAAHVQKAALELIDPIVHLPYLLFTARAWPLSNILEDFESASPYFCTFLANRICD